MTSIPTLPLNNVENLVRFGATLRGKQVDHVWTPRNPFEAENKVRNYQEDATPASVFYTPDTWRSEYQLLTRNVLHKDGYAIVHRNPNAFLKGKIKMSCCVRNVPSLSALKAVIKREFTTSSYDLWNSPKRTAEAVKDRKRVEVEAPNPTIWSVSAAHDSHIFICDALTGTPLLWLRDCKLNVGITSLSHAPFMGFINKQLQVVPIHHPFDLLPLKEHHLIEADYVWVGFADGSLRLFPANHEHFSESERASNMARGDIADIVFEVPKFHAGAVVSITRSPSLEHGDDVELSTKSRLSTTMKHIRSTTDAMTDADAKKKHLSLVCTASADSVVVVWDVQKIYQTLQRMRETNKEEQKKSSPAAAVSQHVITVEHCGSKKTLSGVKSSCKITCVMVKLRPLLRLKGGVAGLTSLCWISSLVTTSGYKQERDPVKVTRASVEDSAPDLVKSRREVQIATRFERREEQRCALELGEEEMCDVEKELRLLLPPLALEPPQSARVNLILAGDSVGTVHVWNLDEELERNTKENETSALESVHCSPSKEAPLKNVHADPNGTSAAKTRPSVQTSAVHISPSTSAKGGPVTRAKKVSQSPSGYVSQTAPPPLKGSTRSAMSNSSGAVTVPPVNLSRIEFRSSTSSPRQSTPRMSRLQLLAAQRQGNVPRKVHACDPVSAPKAVSRRRTMTEVTLPNRLRVEASEDVMLRQQSSARKLVAKDVPQLDSPSFHTPCKGSFSVTTSIMSPSPQHPKPSTLKESSPTSFISPGRSPASGSCGRSTGTTRRTPHESPLAGSPGRSSTSPGRLSPALATPHSTRNNSKEISSVESQGIRKTKTNGEHSLMSARNVASNGTKRCTVSNGHSANELATRASPSPRVPATSRSVSRSPAQKSVNSSHSRSAKCRIEFTGGVAVTGMTAIVPPRISVTMRRIPNPVERERSLLEDPVAEEVEKRILENSFEELDNQKALFFVFQYIQLFLSVEGAILNFRFVPEWTAKDQDRRQLFKQRDNSAITQKFKHEEEVPLNRFLILPYFNLHIKKLVLDAHSQPVCAMHLNIKQKLLWAARNDGLVSIFSTENKFLVSRIPHPSASEALGPPDPVAWSKQLHQFLHHSNYMTATRRLNKHKETLEYDSARFSGFVPFCRTTQKSFAMVCESGQVRGDSAYFSPSDISVCLLDGRSNISLNDRKHERHLNVFLNYLRMCRFNANSVRKAQREFYMLEEQRANQKLMRMGSCTVGVFSGLVPLRRAFHLWRQHSQLFGFEHLARKQRAKRLQFATAAASLLLQMHSKFKLSMFFTKWKHWTMERRIHSLNRGISNIIRVSQKRLSRPTADMMERLEMLTTVKCLFRQWKQVIFTKRSKLYEAPVITPRRLEESVQKQGLLGSLQKDGLVDSEMEKDVGLFVHSTLLIYQTRVTVLHFRDELSDSVVDESWMPVLENAEASAATEETDEKKSAVLCYGLIPILQGFLSSSDSVLANVHDDAILKDVLSMMYGMILCMDYILDDPEETLANLVQQQKAAVYEKALFSRGSLHFYGATSSLERIMRYYLGKIIHDEETAISIREIAKEHENLDILLSFLRSHCSHR